MYAVVLVGGFGTRLRPLTSTVPKPMLAVGHRPIIVQLVEQLGAAGVTDVVLALGFKPEPFRAAFPDGLWAGVRLHYAVEPSPLDTAGAVRFAAAFAGVDDTFVVMNGDVLTDVDVAELVRFHRERGAEATLHLIEVEDPSAYGVVDLDDTGCVRAFVEKPAPGTAPSNLANGGTYVLEASILDRIPEGVPTSIERVTFPAVVAQGRLFGRATHDYWIDTGRPDTFRQANLDTLDGRRRAQQCPAIAPTASVDATAIVAHSLVGPGAVVGPGAHLIDSVILADAVIEGQATVTNSIVAGRVGRGAQVTGAVVAADGVVEPGETAVDVRRPEVPA
jgi:mannose-1-phosphate guanylyltransferase